MTIKVTADETLYRNEETGYTVLSVLDGNTHVCAVGIMPEVAPGERLTIVGEWVDHRVYGRQIKVQTLLVEQPTTLDAIERYLGSGIIRGIRETTARQIVQHFGDETMNVLSQNPERLLEISGIGPKRAQMIYDSYEEHALQRSIMLFLHQYQISPALAAKIIKRYGDSTQRLLQENPYRLVEDIEGVGFRTADRIAASMGVERTGEYRLSSGIRYVLATAAQNSGHCYLPRSELVNESSRILECQRELIEQAVDSLILNQLVKAEILENENKENAEEVVIYSYPAWRAEREVAAALIRLRNDDGISPVSEKQIKETLAQMEREEGILLHETQREAIRLAVTQGLSVITGGPGTGKTTIIKCILRLLEGEEVVLAAPTGRAAKRMTESCGREAKTIHRLLEYSGEAEQFSRDANHPIEADTVVIDEMSMVDIFLMRSLLHAVPPGTRMILVGDADQLPSVGAGNVLKDILSSGSVPSIALSEIFRQDEKSMIAVNAHRINIGQPPRLNTKGGDFYFERTASISEAVQTILELCENRLPSFLKLSQPVREIQVLAPSKKSACGVLELNRQLQSVFNPPSTEKKEKLLRETVFREGDKVMQIKNNYSMTWRKEGILSWEEGQGVYNGDIGFITEIDGDTESITVLFDDGREVMYDFTEADELELAYCISIHKSQGSEFPVVIIPVMGGPPILMNRSLLYTAVTRARKMVMLVGRETVIDQMIQNNEVRRRYTSLDRRLAQLSDSLITKGREKQKGL